MTPIPDSVLPPEHEPHDDEAAIVCAISNAIMQAGLAGNWALVDWLWTVIEECY